MGDQPGQLVVELSGVTSTMFGPRAPGRRSDRGLDSSPGGTRLGGGTRGCRDRVPSSSAGPPPGRIPEIVPHSAHSDAWSHAWGGRGAPRNQALRPSRSPRSPRLGRHRASCAIRLHRATPFSLPRLRTFQQSENVGGDWRCSRQGQVRAPTEASQEPKVTACLRVGRFRVGGGIRTRRPRSYCGRSWRSRVDSPRRSGA